MKCGAILILALLIYSTAYAELNPQKKIFVLAGQSNMSGRGLVSELPSRFPTHAHRIWNFTNAGYWELAQEPIDDAENQKYSVSADPDAGVGLGLAFADALAEMYPSWHIGLVSSAKGASSIDAWSPNMAPSTLYGSCLERCRFVEQAGELLGVLWYQGESDTYSLQAVKSYPEKFRDLVNAFRRDLKNDGLRFVTVGLAEVERPGDGRFLYWKDFQKMQSQINIDGVRMVAAKDLRTFYGVHLTTRSQLILGARLSHGFLVGDERE